MTPPTIEERAEEACPSGIHDAAARSVGLCHCEEITLALRAYGDQRAEEARAEENEACAEVAIAGPKCCCYKDCEGDLDIAGEIAVAICARRS